MKQNRDMFYSDYNYGGYTTPMPNMMMQQAPNIVNQSANMISTPNMFNQSANMMASGPNIAVPFNNNEQMMYQNNDIESRISKLEHEVKRLESKVTKLENEISINNTPDVEVNSSMYMI